MRAELPTLDRVPLFDDRSREFPVRGLIGEDRPVRYKQIWTARTEPLDQGKEGACVGFSFASELAATPIRYVVDNNIARELYQIARAEDKAVGKSFASGASVLGGAKACKRLNLISTYYWAFSIDDVIDCLVKKGPVIFGTNWYSGMYDTTYDGLVKIDGEKVGGHAIMVNGYWPGHPMFGDCVMWTNSWGSDYGINGRGFVRLEDFKRLMYEDGEICIPTDVRL
jgi:hypothetical protein